MNMSRIIELALQHAEQEYNNHTDDVLLSGYKWGDADKSDKLNTEVEFLTNLSGKIGLGLVKEVNTEDLDFSQVLDRLKIVHNSMRCTDEVLQLSVIKDEETKEYKTFITYR